jgi:prepilin-type processing-associated H-X9-DG protein
MKLDWEAGERVERERAKRLVVEARQQGMKVKRLGDRMFSVTGISKRTGQRVTHVIHQRGGNVLFCDCMWADRNPYRMCKHTAVVDLYLRRKAQKEKSRDRKRAQQGSDGGA